MDPIRVGLVADPAKPTAIARRIGKQSPKDDDRPAWNIEVISEPFTTACEDVETPLSRLKARAQDRGWDLVVGLTELPLRHDKGGYLSVETDADQRSAVVSLPALGGLRMHARSRDVVHELVRDMADPTSSGGHGPSLARRSGRTRLLTGMVLANRPWLLVPGLKSALVAALTTGAIATINNTVWELALSLPSWRLVIATIVSIALVVGWLLVDADLWDRPDDDSVHARDRSRLYNISTLLTLTAGVVICYVALYILNLMWAFFILDPAAMSVSLGRLVDYHDLFVLAWFVASAATVGGALGSGFESDDAIRAATYSKRERDRRERLAHEGT